MKRLLIILALLILALPVLAQSTTVYDFTVSQQGFSISQGLYESGQGFYNNNDRLRMNRGLSPAQNIDTVRIVVSESLNSGAFVRFFIDNGAGYFSDFTLTTSGTTFDFDVTGNAASGNATFFEIWIEGSGWTSTNRLRSITFNPSSATNTPTPTNTATPTNTPTPTATPTNTATPTATGTPIDTSTPAPTSTPGNTSTPTPTSTPGQQVGRGVPTLIPTLIVPQDEVNQALATANANTVQLGENEITTPGGVVVLPDDDFSTMFAIAKWLLAPTTAAALFGPFEPIFTHFGIFMTATIALFAIYAVVYVSAYVIRFLVWFFRLIMEIGRSIANAIDAVK
jgi:hypothetical protein